MTKSDPRDRALGGEETTRIDEETRAAIALERWTQRTFSLLVYHGGGMRVVPLEPGKAVVIGRDHPSDVRIADHSLSRIHARFTRTGDRVAVADLGSTNGSWTGKKRIDHAEVRPGEEVLIGSVTVCVHAPAPGEGELPGVEGHDRFCARVEEEVERARCFGRSFAVLMIGASRAGLALHRFYREVRERLRPIDKMALYSAEIAEVLIAEAGRDEALAVAKSIASVTLGGEQPLRVGVAVYPDAAKGVEEILSSARAAARRATAERPVEAAPMGARDLVKGARDDDAPIAVSEPMRAILESATRIAGSSIPVLIHGETGTGKEVVARAIHERGRRRDKPLVYVNCGAIPDSLVESVLFGHEKGAFTGADQRKKGLFEAAEGGTVMLDEIAELRPPAQAALLRILDKKRLLRVGASEEIDVNVRVIAATHSDLEAMCEKGTFRRDLFYRLNTMTLTVPPLRDRIEEIEPLVRRFLERARAENDSPVESITDEALAALKRHRWPGNVRELRNVIERAVAIARSRRITEEDLPDRLRDAGGAPAPPTEAPAPRVSTVAPPAPAPVAARKVKGDLKSRLRQFEREIILEGLGAAGGNQTQAAELLGIPLRTLAYKIKSLDIRKLGYGSE